MNGRKGVCAITGHSRCSRIVEMIVVARLDFPNRVLGGALGIHVNRPVDCVVWDGWFVCNYFPALVKPQASVSLGLPSSIPAGCWGDGIRSCVLGRSSKVSMTVPQPIKTQPIANERFPVGRARF